VVKRSGNRGEEGRGRMGKRGRDGVREEIGREGQEESRNDGENKRG